LKKDQKDSPRAAVSLGGIGHTRILICSSVGS
jgi:hypothetical protein